MLTGYRHFHDGINRSGSIFCKRGDKGEEEQICDFLTV